MLRLTPLTGVLLLCFALHWAVGTAVGLTVDEAHYLLYARHWAWSYFDHPPLIGWVQWPLVWMNAPDAVLRLLPGLVWVATMLVVYRVTLRLQADDARAPAAAFWAVLALCAAPLLHLLGIGLLPDTLLMLWVALLMNQTLVLMDERQTLKWLPWVVWGGLLGLAGLSKYTAILPALAAGICLLRMHRVQLLRYPGFWLATALAAVMVLPVFVWNAQHDWISFAYQVQHGKGSAWQGLSVLQFLLLQMLAYGVLLIAAIAGWWRAQRWQRDAGWFFAVSFVVHAVMSGGGSSLPHWTAPAWVAAAPFAGMALSRWAQMRMGHWLVGTVLTFQSITCIGLLLLMLSGGRPWLPSSAAEVAAQPNPFADLHGWNQAGARAKVLAEQQQLNVLAVQNWTLASRLAWYARPLPVPVLDERFDQFDLWFGAMPQGGNALLVDWSYMAYALPLAPHGFSHCRWLETMPIQRWGEPLGYFRFYACYGWIGSPQPLRKEP